MLPTRRALCLLALCVAACSAAWATDDTTKDKPTLTVQEKQKHLASFDKVWETIRDRHYDPKLGGLDWEGVRKELRPKVEAATSTGEVRKVLNDMLKRLKQSHMVIMSGDALDALQGDGSGRKKRVPGGGEPGLQVRIVEGQPTVFQVRAGGPADKAGVRTGWVLVKVDDEELAPALEKVRKAHEKSSMLDHYLAHAVTDRLHGFEGDEVAITFRVEDDQEKTVKIKLAEPPGVLIRFGHLPPFHIAFEHRRLEGNIHYMTWNAFFSVDTVMPQIHKVVEENRDAAGMILDIRGNPGGIGVMSVGIGSCFVQKPNQKLGTMTMRTGQMHFVLNPGPRGYAGPLAILVDGCSASTSEIFAGGMQDIKRARVFGTRTAGAALPANVIRLPNGDGFMFVVANYISSGGEVLEGRGVIPDEEVKLDRKTLLAGRDAQLDAAVTWINAQKK
jgi:carboxyl-terminal processing protease